MFGRLHLRLQLVFKTFANSAAKESGNFRRNGWMRRYAIPVMSAGYLYYIPRQVSLATNTKNPIK